MPKHPLTITADIKDLHALIVQKQLTKDASNDGKIENLQRKVDYFYWGGN
jgi:hypothetical protein